MLLFLVLRRDSENISGTFHNFKERKRAITIAVAIVQGAICIWEAKQKRSYAIIYKNKPKNKAKRLKGITFAFAKLKER